MADVSGVTVGSRSVGADRFLVLLLIVAVAALAIVLRLYHLDLKSISHPEVFAPGIPLPVGVSAPPPRLTLAETLDFHFHVEPHPPGWYLMMMGWVKVAGYSEWALRLPSALFSGATVVGIFWVGRMTFGTVTGLLAASLLALHGFHIYWGQIARMYAPGTFWALLATGLLLVLARSRLPRPWIEAGYVTCILIGTQTTELVWAVLFTQVFWVAFVLWSAGKGMPRLLSLQSLALMVSAPGILHAVYRARTGAAKDPTLGFLGEYLSFGFLFGKEDGTAFGYAIPVVAGVLLLAAALVLIGLGLGRGAGQMRGETALAPLPGWLLILACVSVTLFMVWLAAIAHRRTFTLLALAVLPVLAFALPSILEFVRAALGRLAPAAMRHLQGQSPAKALIVLIGLIAPVLIAVASFVVSVAEARAFLVFVPALIILMAAGAVHGLRTPAARSVSVLGLFVLFAFSLPYNAERPVSPRDYKGLYLQMQPDLRAGDMVLVRARDWSDTPMFYYLPAGLRYITDDYEGTLARSPGARIWLITWPNTRIAETTDARHLALAGLAPLKTYESLRARAQLYIVGGAP